MVASDAWSHEYSTLYLPHCEDCPLRKSPDYPCVLEGREGEIRFNWFDYTFTACPMFYRQPVVNDGWTLYSDYKKGLLPFSGGVYDQPAFVVAVIRACDRIYSEFEAWRLEELKNAKHNRRDNLRA